MTNKAIDVGLLVLRLGIGGTLAAHGAQKLFGWFGGYGPTGTGQYMASLGFPGEGKRNAVLSGLAEFGGGTLLAVGLGTGPAGAAVTGNMIVASSTHTPKVFFNTAGGYELPATFGLVGTVLAITGPGKFSLDRATGGALNRPWMAVVGLVCSLAGAAYMVSGRRPPESAPEEMNEVNEAESPSGSAE